LKRFLYFLAIVVLLGGMVCGFLLFRGSGSGETKNLVIARGASLRQVADLLYREEMIAYPRFFKLLLRVTGGSSRVRAGEFRFQKKMRAISALRTLYFGEPILHRVTIPEGWTIRQIAQILVNEKLVEEKKFLSLTLNPKAAAKYKLSAPSLEGFLFPDTYTFSKIDGAEFIIDHIVQNFLRKYERDFKQEAVAKGWRLEQLITLASIIEKETGAPEERELISSVFHNRLKKKMRLQSDPTTIYGIPNFDGNLRRADLTRYSPYNTYVISGLPPGPIANPGWASIRAALNPARTNFLYFVSNNKGGHIFSETYLQHQRQVNSFQSGK